MPPAVSFSDKFTIWVSPFTSRVTYKSHYQKLPQIIILNFFLKINADKIIWYERRYLMHGIDVLRAAILKSVWIVFGGPNGWNRGVASLSNYAPQRPRVYQVSSEHYVLYQNVVVVAASVVCFYGVVWGSDENGVGGGGITHWDRSTWWDAAVSSSAIAKAWRRESEWRRGGSETTRWQKVRHAII